MARCGVGSLDVHRFRVERLEHLKILSKVIGCCNKHVQTALFDLILCQGVLQCVEWLESSGWSISEIPCKVIWCCNKLRQETPADDGADVLAEVGQCHL